MTDPDADPLHELRSRIRDTQEAAERLAGEAASARAQQTPPAGWATPEDQSRRTTEVHAFVTMLDSLRDLIPDDLREQFRELVRQVLLLARALIDWWAERLEAPADGPTSPSRPAPVQDIPIA